MAHSLLTRSVRVQVSANILNLQLEALLSAPFRALESKMLKKMGNAVIMLPLVCCTSVDKHAHAARLRGRLLRCDREAVLQSGNLCVGRVEKIFRELIVRRQ